MKNENLKILGSVVAGIAVGTIIGLLTAPDSGKKTLKKLDFEALKLKDRLKNTISDTVDSLKESLQKSATTVASEAETVKPEHTGESEGEKTGRFSHEELSKKAREV